MSLEDKSIFQKIGDAVADFAPGIATILTATGVGAPVGAAIGAVGALSRAFGLGSASKPEDVLNAISADPEIRLKAMVAENDFKVKMREAEIEDLKTRLKDVQDARRSDVEKVRITGKRDLSGEVFDWIMVIGFFTVLGIRMFIDIPVTQSENVGILLGVLGTAFMTVVNYKRGTSQSSKEKTEIMERMAGK